MKAKKATAQTNLTSEGIAKLTAGLVLLAAAAAQAVDGVIEVNEAEVIARGGFPYVINAPGHYRLTGNITVFIPDQHAIVVQADDVSIDLNGFVIRGPGRAVGSGVGIRALADGNGIRVNNGTVTRFGGGGIQVGQTAHLEAIRVIENGQRGIEVQKRSVVQRCLAWGNDGDGVFVASGSRVTDTLAVNNGGDGIEAEDGTELHHNVAADNGRHGVNASAGVVAVNNVASSNFLNGFQFDSGTLAANCARLNRLDGFQGNVGVLIENAAIDNLAYGMDLSFNNTGYRANSITSAPGGNTVFFGSPLGVNVCNGVAVCP